MEHPNNSWTKPLEQQARQIHADDELRSGVLLLKTAYMNNCQALLHNDLHRGAYRLPPCDEVHLDRVRPRRESARIQGKAKVRRGDVLLIHHSIIHEESRHASREGYRRRRNRPGGCG
jgi:hypothetical protein